MPSFDIVNRVAMEEVDNAINNTLKEVATRYDFRGTRTELTFDKKEKKLHMVAGDKMKIDALKEMFQQKAAKRNIDLRTFKFDEAAPTAGGAMKREVTIREGIEMELAKKMVAIIKQTKMKVQASIQGDQVRVTGKQIDDLQAVMQLLRGQNLDTPLQFVNMKS